MLILASSSKLAVPIVFKVITDFIIFVYPAALKASSDIYWPTLPVAYSSCLDFSGVKVLQ